MSTQKNVSGNHADSSAASPANANIAPTHTTPAQAVTPVAARLQQPSAGWSPGATRRSPAPNPYHLRHALAQDALANQAPQPYPYHEDVSLLHERLHHLETEGRIVLPEEPPNRVPYVGPVSELLARVRHRRIKREERERDERRRSGAEVVTAEQARIEAREASTPFRRQCRLNHDCSGAYASHCNGPQHHHSEEQKAVNRAVTPNNRSMYAKNVKWQKVREAALQRVRDKVAADHVAEVEATRVTATRGLAKATQAEVDAFLERQQAWLMAREVSVGLAPAAGLPWRLDCPTVPFCDQPIRPRLSSAQDVEAYIQRYCVEGVGGYDDEEDASDGSQSLPPDASQFD